MSRCGAAGEEPTTDPAHSLDTAFSPFSDSFLASASEDGKILLWEIPGSAFEGWSEDGWGVDKSVRGGQGEVEDLRSCGALMAGGGRKVGQVVWHPTAEGLLASASGDHLVRGGRRGGARCR